MLQNSRSRTGLSGKAISAMLGAVGALAAMSAPAQALGPSFSLSSNGSAARSEASVEPTPLYILVTRLLLTSQEAKSDSPLPAEPPMSAPASPAGAASDACATSKANEGGEEPARNAAATQNLMPMFF